MTRTLPDGARPRRVAMIGLDGASLPFIEANAADLPVLRQVLQSGVLHHLRARTDAITGAMWPDFFTGDHSGVHGFYHDLAWDPQRMCIARVSERTLDYAPFWHRFDGAGLSVVAVDVPHMLAPRPRRGVEVVAWNGHDHMTRFAVHPPPLRRVIRRQFGGRLIGYETPARRTTRQMEDIRRRLIESARQKSALCCWLLREQPQWDFFIAVFGEAHRGGHLLWPHALPDPAPPPPGALLEVYRAIDRGLGEILTALRGSGAMTLVFAPNGMGQEMSHDHFALAVMDRINALFLAREDIAPAHNQPERSMLRRLRAVAPDRIQHALGQLAPVWVRDQVVNRTFTGRRDWSRTPALTVRGDVHTYVRYNLRGRESAGMLEPGSPLLGRYEEWLVQCWRSLRDADTGEPIVREIVRGREAYPGPRADVLPDVIAAYRYTTPARRLRSEILGQIPAEIATGRCGNHRPEGFCAVLAPTDECARAGAFTHVRDFAPMILGHYGFAD
jgi:predicted AlkP superfamily phosphohydrolase/phosphomutase